MKVMTELTFLIELLLHHKLPAATKDAISERIQAVEALLISGRPNLPHVTYEKPQLAGPAIIGGAKQSPSTAALLAKHPDLVQQMNQSSTKEAPIQVEAPPEPPKVAVENVAQTPAAIDAMMKRQEMIANSRNEKGRFAPKMRGPL
jgi:hypothetical protein